MFGYIYVNEQELKLKDYTAYRSFYCGLCRNLHQRYGRTAQMMLNYDLTFLAILLTGLYEPETKAEEYRCIPHPFQKHRMTENEAVAYAADMTVLLSYQKMQDDWKDEKSVPGFAVSMLLRKDYQKLMEQYPRQGRAIEENIRLLSEAEQQNQKDIDYVSGLTGCFLAEIFVWKDDIWQEELRNMGFYLGKFVYLMDALEDVEKDRKKGNYNLFLESGEVWSKEQAPKYKEILTAMAAEAARSFERLPIITCADILRNILYSGVWCRYLMVGERERQRKEKVMDQRRQK